MSYSPESMNASSFIANLAQIEINTKDLLPYFELKEAINECHIPSLLSFYHKVNNLLILLPLMSRSQK